MLAPERFDQAVVGQDLRRPYDEQCKERSLLGPGKGNPPRFIDYLERAKDSEVHVWISVGNVERTGACGPWASRRRLQAAVAVRLPPRCPAATGRRNDRRCQPQSPNARATQRPTREEAHMSQAIQHQ